MPRVFAVTEDHIRLLKSANIGQFAGDRPIFAQDSKRPYGNGDLLGDLHEILETQPALVKHGEKIFTEEQDERVMEVHRSLPMAVTCIFRTGLMEPGVFVNDSDYSDDWKREDGRSA